MARLKWGGAGTRYYEAGVDRGVLYVENDPGVPWNGLKSVTESSSGGDARIAHIDGVKYLNVAKNEDFEATIEAFYSPPEFDACDGMRPLEKGLWATAQRRRAFGLSYRTLVGNDMLGTNYGYRIHLIYNAIAAPSQRTHNTLGDVADAGSLSWSLTAKPVRWPGVKPTAHLIIDSTQVDVALLAALEDIIYGTDEEAPRLPYPEELQGIFVEHYDDLIVELVDLGGGLYDISSVNGRIILIGDGLYQITSRQVTDLGDGVYQITSSV